MAHATIPGAYTAERLLHVLNVDVMAVRVAFESRTVIAFKSD